MFVLKLLPLVLVAGLSAQAPGPKVTYRPAITTIETGGEPGNVLTVEAADQLKSPAWDVLSSFVLTNRTATVSDPWCGGKPQRFYRISQSPPGDFPLADNFRLIDQEGKSHELAYFAPDTNLHAFVLIFTANGCAELEERLPAIQALRTKFESQGVTFWMINSNPADTRAEIAAEATRLGVKFPVLHDAAQTVSRVYHVASAAEVVCVSRDGFQIFYRGALDERTAGTVTRNYLDEAVTAFLSGRTPQVLQTKVEGCEVPNTPLGDLAYSSVIAPLLQDRCVSCHSPGNIAPWAMTNHAIVKAYAPSIKEKVSSKEMPPWHADPEYGRFTNDMSLSVTQEKVLIDWLMAGAPRGSGIDPLENVPPPPPRWPAELGEPDLILRPPEQQVDPGGVEPYRYIFVDTGLTQDRWLKASIVKPTNTRVVHHYLVWEGKTMSQMATGLAGYVPGMQDTAFPADTGILLRAGSSLTFNLHYTPSGEPETDHPELALWFHKTPPAKELLTLPLLDMNFTIPSGAREHEVQARLPIALPFSVTVYGMAPHMHLRGTRMKFEVEYPNKQVETLLSVPKYHFHWQTRYQLAEPKVIPAGSRVWVTGAFDNSTLNMMNPGPEATVKWGEQSFEEMLIGYFVFTIN